MTRRQPSIRALHAIAVALLCLFAWSAAALAQTAAADTAADTDPRSLLVAGETLPIGKQTADEPYPLDQLPRTINATGRVRCPKVAKVRYKGEVIRYHAPVLIYAGFRERLRRFEAVVRDTAIEIYGRAPRRIRHIGTYNCRRIRLYPTYLSEHGIANGIDIAGFDFGPARRKRGAARSRPSPPSTVPRALRRGFRVRLLRHWNAKRGVGHSHHRRFLRLLAARLVQRRDIFRVLLGPAYPGHKNHFHFDVSPWRLVDL